MFRRLPSCFPFNHKKKSSAAYSSYNNVTRPSPGISWADLEELTRIYHVCVLLMYPHKYNKYTPSGVA